MSLSGAQTRDSEGASSSPKRKAKLTTSAFPDRFPQLPLPDHLGVFTLLLPLPELDLFVLLIVSAPCPALILLRLSTVMLIVVRRLRRGGRV